MSSNDNMSDSEDGQLRSPNDEQYLSGDNDDDHDADLLNIKPPQARSSYTREVTGARRKEKKHSKERKHKERNSGAGSSSGNRHERGLRNSRGGESGGEREQRRSGEYRREERLDMEQRYHHRNERELLPNNDRRYQPKHGGHPYHYPQPPHHHQPPPGAHQVYAAHHHLHHHTAQPHLHMPSRPPGRHDYYHADYHHIHNNRGHAHTHSHHGVGAHYEKHLAEYVSGGNNGNELDMARDARRYKYTNYEHSKDAESLEQDLRSRLLSKRHKYYGKDYEMEEQNYERSRHIVGDVGDGVEHKERGNHSVEEHDRKAERHKLRREKERHNVIELLDSPEFEIEPQRRHKRNKHSREQERERAHIELSEEEEEEEQQALRRKTPDDPELLARRAKLLAAEREKEKRKETAREELEARREMLRERKDALSPSAVAASVTAGLNVVAKRKRTDEVNPALRRKKRAKQHKEHSGGEGEDEVENDDSEESESDTQSDKSGSDSAAESIDSSITDKKNRKKKKQKKKDEGDDEDEDLPLPDSPLSIGELYKSPTQKRDERSHSHSTNSSHSSRRSSVSSRSRSVSQSRSSSDGDDIEERSRSSRSSSGTRSEERGMAQNEPKSDEKLASETETDGAQNNSALSSEAAVPCDENGIPLPNYFPGVQGCRSVEEFQCLNRIEEGTYGVVYRAKDKRTNEIVALKRLKMEKEKEGFPITSLREINTLLKGQHPNIVTVREIVVGSNMDKIFIVMDYVEHDLKSLMETMKTRKQCFFPGEVKCLTQQLLLAVAHLHDNWILHRDLKTSNLLLSHKGILKVGDFGLAREYGSPLKKYTSLVVTLWYRAPELLLCSTEYSTPIDVWSVGCIFAEFLQMSPLVPGKSEVDQLNRIFKELGTPNEKIWPGYNELPAVKNMLSQNSQFTEYPVSQLRKHFLDKTTEIGISLLQGLLTYDPKQRLTAEAALKHAYFKELPLPIDPSMFPTWPAKSELGARRANSPKPPSGGSQFKQLAGDDGAAAVANSSNTTASSGTKLSSGIITGNKKSVTNTTGFVLNAGMTQRQLAMGPGFSLKF